MSDQPVSSLKVILAFAAIYLIWGSTYLAILISIQSIPPFLMIGIRFLLAGLLLLIGCMLFRYPMPSLGQVQKNSLAGVMMLACGTGAVAWVEQYITSGLTAIVVAIAPIWFVLLDKQKWHYHFSNKRIIFGLLVGLSGVVLLFADKRTFDLQGHPFQLASLLVLLCGSLAWVSGSLFSKYFSPGGSAPVNAAIQMLAAGVALMLTSFAFGEYQQFNIDLVTWQSVVALFYQIIFGSLVAYLAYVWLLSIRTPSLVGTYALVNPAVAVFLGWLIADEKIVLRQVVALVIILSGVVMVTLLKPRQRQ